MLTGRKGVTYMKLLTLFCSFFILASCGYTIVGKKGIYQGEVVSLYVPVFKNQSLEPQVSQFFTESFTMELVLSGLFDVNKENAPNTLRGTIATVKAIPSAFNQNGLALQKTVYVTLNLALLRKDGRSMKSWSLADLEPYDVSDINLEDPNEREALKRIAGRMSRRFSALVLADIDRKAPQ